MKTLKQLVLSALNENKDLRLIKNRMKLYKYINLNFADFHTDQKHIGRDLNFSSVDRYARHYQNSIGICRPRTIDKLKRKRKKKQ